MIRFLTTLFTRIASLILSFIIVLLNSRYLGAGGVGIISLVTLAISIIIMINELAGGGALVYLASRHAKWTLLRPAYVWAGISSFLFFFIIRWFQLVPPHLMIYTSLAGFIFTVTTANFNYLIGMKKMMSYNILYFLQLFLLFILLLIEYEMAGRNNEMSYIYSLLTAYLITGILSFILISGIQGETKINQDKSLPALLKFGSLNQLANIIQLFNYRFSYYIIERICGKENLGRYAVATQISETSWILGRSSAIVNYSDVSNSGDKDMAGRVLLVAKFTGLLTFLSMAVLNLIPAGFYKFLFGKDFTGLNLVILILSPGIILLSLNMIICSYFSGTGRVHINTIGSVIGLCFTIPLALWLIPGFGIPGAAMVCSVSYCVTTLWGIIQFAKYTRLKLINFLLSFQDIKKITKIVVHLLNRSIYH